MFLVLTFTGTERFQYMHIAEKRCAELEEEGKFSLLLKNFDGVEINSVVSLLGSRFNKAMTK
jgi:hypothetical protein